MFHYLFEADFTVWSGIQGCQNPCGIYGDKGLFYALHAKIVVLLIAAAFSIFLSLEGCSTSLEILMLFGFILFATLGDECSVVENTIQRLIFFLSIRKYTKWSNENFPFSISLWNWMQKCQNRLNLPLRRTHFRHTFQLMLWIPYQKCHNPNI